MRRATLYFSLFLYCLTAVSQGVEKIELRSDLSGNSKPFPKYWKSTGFSPADLLDYPDMEMTLDYLNASGAIDYIRPHYLLDHVKITSFATPDQKIDWSGLDAKLDKIAGAGLKMIFELMGNPADREIDFSKKSDLNAWKEFISDLATRYQGRFGKETIENWYFETTNEPDLTHFWKHGLVNFLNYYDACSEGLLNANPRIRFGGPGTAKGASETFKTLLDHCRNGKNYFTGETGVRIDFISTHRKNIPHQMIADELGVWYYLEESFPEMTSIWPVMNDEADPIAGWGIPYYWRTGPWYGAFIVQSVDLHNRLVLDSISNKYLILSNDHGFLGSWGKRTQMARFIPGNNDQIMRGASGTGGGREISAVEDTRDPVKQFFLIKKPSLTVMSMMNLFGEQRFDVEGISDQRFPNAGAIVSRSYSGDIIISIYNKPEMDLKANQRKPTMEAPASQIHLLEKQSVEISLSMEGLGDGIYKLLHYKFDNTHSHAYQKWVEMGSPVDPTLAQYHMLAAAMEPELIERLDVHTENSGYRIDVTFPSSGVSFFVMAKQKEKPERVSDLKFKRYCGLNGVDMIMLTWNKSTDMRVLSYEVFARGPEDSSYKKVNPSNLLAAGFAHVIENANGYRYKVRMVDYWKRKGEFSEDVLVTY